MYGRLSTAGFLMVALLLAAPAAQAAQAGTGELEIQDEATLSGILTATAPDAAFYLEEGSLATFDVRGARIEVTRVTLDRTTMTNPAGGPVRHQGEADTQRETFEDATLALTRYGSQAQLLAFSKTLDPTRAEFETRATSTLRAVTRDVVVAPLTQAEGPEGEDWAFTYIAQNAARLDTQGPARLHFAGDFTLFLSDVDVRVASPAQQGAYTSGQEETLAPGETSARGTRDTFLLVRVTSGDATLATQSGTARYYAQRDGLLTLAGTLGAQHASGHVQTTTRNHALPGGQLALRGTFQLTPTVGTADGLPDPGASSTTTVAPAYALALRGQIDHLHAPGSISDARPGVVAAGALGSAALAAILAYFWPLVRYAATAAALPLYTRLRQPEILDNAARARIYEIIRQSPGISAREVHRLSTQSWGTVVYHLRQLERHSLVSSRRVGRSRNFYENHGKYRGMEVELATLKSARALEVAQRVRDAPGLTQETLIEVVGLPQPTVSYYVRKLKEAGLVEERREGRYARYFPSEQLAGLLAVAHGSASANAQTASPAQPETSA